LGTLIIPFDLMAHVSAAKLARNKYSIINPEFHLIDLLVHIHCIRHAILGMRATFYLPQS
jgi:hypothetical protein